MKPLYPTNPIRIPSILADGGNFKNPFTNRTDLIGIASVKLWMFLRGKCPSGQGWITLNVKECAQAFGRSIATIERLLKQGEAYFCWRFVKKISAGVYKIYFMGQNKFCVMNGIRDFGAVVEMADSDIWSHLQVLATEATVLYGQKKSQFAARVQKDRDKERGIEDKRSLINVEKVFAESSEQCLGLTEVNNRFAVIDESVIPYGSSIETTAAILARGKRTISRRMSRKYTDKIGVDPIEKRQLIHVSPDYEQMVLQEEFFGDTSHFGHYFRYKGKPAKACTNLYKEDRVLISMRYRRAELNRAWAKIDSESSAR